jgi:hypothetical protein
MGVVFYRGLCFDKGILFMFLPSAMLTTKLRTEKNIALRLSYFGEHQNDISKTNYVISCAL